MSHVSTDSPAFLLGISIVLRSLEISDDECLWRWFADREVVRYSLSRWQFPSSRHETRQWLERTLHDKNTLTLGIVEQINHTLIGIAGISSMSLINHSGEYFILIGDKTVWSRGYGTEATRLVVAYGFRSLNLYRIALTVSQGNTGGIKAYQRAGFVHEGVMRAACYRDGAYHDKVMMSILRPEWGAEQGGATRTMDMAHKYTEES